MRGKRAPRAPPRRRAAAPSAAARAPRASAPPAQPCGPYSARRASPVPIAASLSTPDSWWRRLRKRPQGALAGCAEGDHSLRQESAGCDP
eukprot:6190448-Pleurochrysis_carterae.AAC.1